MGGGEITQGGQRGEERGGPRTPPCGIPAPNGCTEETCARGGRTKPARNTGRKPAGSQGKRAFVGRGGDQGKTLLKVQEKRRLDNDNNN